MRMRIAVIGIIGLLALGGCASGVGDRGPAPPGEPYEATVTVIDDGSGANACTVIMESFPPQCGDPLPILGWDWSQVEGWQQSGDVRWGDYRLTGVVVDGELATTMTPVPRSPETTPLPRDTGEILQPGHGTGPETGR